MGEYLINETPYYDVSLNINNETSSGDLIISNHFNNFHKSRKILQANTKKFEIF